MNELDKELVGILSLFTDEEPTGFNVISTSRGDDDFRETAIAALRSGGKLVVKLADNDFTDPGRIESWSRCAAEYRALGYYAPAIFRDRNGSFPRVSYRGRTCTAYAEEFAPYKPLEDRVSEAETSGCISREKYEREIWTMTARVAARYHSFASHPSAYCLFETFCPSDKTDEVLENALSWWEYAKTLPQRFQPQLKRIWQLWQDNRAALEPLYKKLPTCVLQADLNTTNILLDENDSFVGIYDFNLSGREVLLNYIFRELTDDFEPELEMIKRVLLIVRENYKFNDNEKNTALLLYRCLKPLWSNKLEKLRSLGPDEESVQNYLDRTERALTENIDFTKYM